MTAGPALRAVLWDFGGVLTTSPFEAFARYEEARGLPSDFLRRLNSSNPDGNAWAAFERGELDLAGFVARFEAEAEQAGGQVDAQEVLALLDGELRPAMVEAVRRCHLHFRSALLTNNFALMERESPRHGDVLDHFDVVVESSSAGCRKPDPAFYRLACQQLGIEPAEAVFLDDLGVNLKPARALGMTTIKVVDPDQALADLEGVTGLDLRH